MEIDKFHYPDCLEVAFPSVLNTMYDANSLAAGATCGITEETIYISYIVEKSIAFSVYFCYMVVYLSGFRHYM